MQKQKKFQLRQGGKKMNNEIITSTNWKSRAPIWGGLGTDIRGLTNIDEVLNKANLDWNVLERPVITEDGIPLPGYKATIRDVDQFPLGVVSHNYTPLNNRECYLFLEELLQYGFRFMYAGMFNQGRRTWVLLKAPDNYLLNSDKISEYIVCLNSHDGSSSMRIIFSPIRCICSNMISLTLNNATRSFSFKHTATIQERMATALETLDRNEEYMTALVQKLQKLTYINLNRNDVERFLAKLMPIPENASSIQEQNVLKLRDDVMNRYDNAPDLKNLPETGYRYIQALTDHFTHVEPIRHTTNYRERLFARSLDNGMGIVDKGIQLIA